MAARLHLRPGLASGLLTLLRYFQVALVRPGLVALRRARLPRMRPAHIKALAGPPPPHCRMHIAFGGSRKRRRFAFDHACASLGQPCNALRVCARKPPGPAPGRARAAVAAAGRPAAPPRRRRRAVSLVQRVTDRRSMYILV